MSEPDKTKKGFLGMVKRLFGAASVEKGRIDKKYEDSLAALGRNKKDGWMRLSRD